MGTLDYVFRPEELSIKQYGVNNESLFSSILGNVSEDDALNIFSTRFHSLHGWGQDIESSKSVAYHLSIVGPATAYIVDDGIYAHAKPHK